MPLLNEWNIGDHGRGAIWKVEEEEAFFADHTKILSDIKNDKRRIEHLAGRYLLTHLEAEFPLHAISKDEHDKPRIPGNEFQFSISHSWPYIAVAVDPVDEAGIDIQTWHPRIADIKHKFLSEEEQDTMCHDPKYFTLAWCAKEAVYKWNGRRGVDFKEQLPIAYFNTVLDINIYIHLNKMPEMVFTKNFITPDYACSYVENVQPWAIY